MFFILLTLNFASPTLFADCGSCESSKSSNQKKMCPACGMQKKDCPCKKSHKKGHCAACNKKMNKCKCDK